MPSDFNTILHAVPDTMALVNAKGEITSVNRTWLKFAHENQANEPTEQGVGLNYFDVCETSAKLGSEEAASVMEGIRRVLRGDVELFEVEYSCHSPNERRWFIARITSVTGGGDPVVLISHVNITRRKEAELKLAQESEDNREASLADPLTGLRNRRGLEVFGEALFKHARNLAALYLDLNDFKPINDTHGHREGDRVLKALAGHLTNAFRNSDIVARVGGDEFVVLANLRQTRDLQLLTGRLWREFIHQTEKGEAVTITTSLGVAVKGEEDFPDLKSLIETADKRMYEDKRKRKPGG